MADKNPFVEAMQNRIALESEVSMGFQYSEEVEN
jgi:hypothetical protein